MSRGLAGAMLACVGCGRLFGLDAPVGESSGTDAAPPTEDAGRDANLVDAIGVDGPVPSLVRQITVTGAKVTGGPHADFPLLVATTQTWLRTTTNGGDVENDSGFDIYFSSDQAGTSRLAHEVESYDKATGTLVAWIKVPSLTASTTLYIHYGDPSITTSQANATAVWAGGFEIVLHLATTTDSTAKNTMAPTNTAAGTGKIGPATTFNGTNSAINGGSAAAIDNVFAGGGALDAWIRPASFGEAAFGRIVEKSNAGGWLWMVDDINANNVMSFQHSATTTIGRWRSPPDSIALNTWQHVALVFDTNDSAPLMYINGAAVTVSTQTSPAGALESDAPSLLVVGNDDVGARTFDGVLDEVRVSSVPRTAGWFATQYQNTSTPSSFYTISTPL